MHLVLVAALTWTVRYQRERRLEPRPELRLHALGYLHYRFLTRLLDCFPVAGRQILLQVQMHLQDLVL